MSYIYRYMTARNEIIPDRYIQDNLEYQGLDEVPEQEKSLFVRSPINLQNQSLSIGEPIAIPMEVVAEK